jgi:NitT/TauT family transport system substrate-binding protein
VGVVCAFAASASFAAEERTVTVARQYGIGFMALTVMEHEKLFEKHAAKHGIPKLQVDWTQYGSGAAMNDALLSGKLDFASVGTTAFLTLWSKTVGTDQAVNGVCSFGSFAFYLNTRNPAVKSVRDLGPKDKIALPAVKVSNQALVLQIAARREFGKGHEFDLDKYTVSMSNPDGATALISGQSEVNAHFTWDPFHSRELKAPGVRTIFNSNDVMEGPASNILVVTTRKFQTGQPVLYAAFLDAFRESTDIIRNDPQRAARVYLDVTKERGTTVDDVVKMIKDPNNDWSLVPVGTMKFVKFMQEIGSLKKAPQTWNEMFFPPINASPNGS